MSIPKKIKSGGFEWIIEENADVAYEGNAFGSTHLNSQKIFIDKGSTKQKKEQTLIHELMHVVVWQSGLDRRFSDKDFIPEEHIVATLSHGLYSILKDNNLLNFDSNK